MSTFACGNESSGQKSPHLGRLEKSKFAGMMRHSNMEWLVRWSGTTKTRLDP